MKTLGRWCEDLVAKHLGWKRVPYSGSVWPHVEDLIREVSTAGEYPKRRYLAQVKGTRGEGFLLQWNRLVAHAEAERAGAFWYDVVVTPNVAYIFERRLVKTIALGVAGDE